MIVISSSFLEGAFLRRILQQINKYLVSISSKADELKSSKIKRHAIIMEQVLWVILQIFLN